MYSKELILSLRDLIVLERPIYTQYSNTRTDGIEEYSFLPSDYKQLIQIIGGIHDNVEQLYFDFIPGYGILPFQQSVDLYQSEYWLENKELGYFPIMRNFSSDYYVITKNDAILLIFHDSDPIQMYDSTYLMILSVYETYKKGGYFVQDGILDVSEKIEEEVGYLYNTKSPYWKYFCK